MIIVSRGSVLPLSPGMRTGGQGPLSEDTNTRHSKVEELAGNTSEVSMSLTHPTTAPPLPQRFSPVGLEMRLLFPWLSRR